LDELVANITPENVHPEIPVEPATYPPVIKYVKPGVGFANVLAFMASFALAAASGYFSIIGLTAIFAASFIPVALMGTALEFGKLVTASWLYRHWKITPAMLKYPLTMAVILLMFITSMGVFGYLSKAHIEQRTDSTVQVGGKVAVIDEKIKYEKSLITDFDKRISQIDTAVDEMTKRGKTSTALTAADAQKKNRQTLVDQRQKEQMLLLDLNSQRAALSSEEKRVEAEVGPLRYVAELIYGSSSEDQLERAVRWMILLIVSVFDPLAVLLLIAANIGLQARKSSLDLQTGFVRVSPQQIKNGV
jgi:hypothetical protein